MMINRVDVVYGLAWGDEGKGKISNALAKQYDYVCRWNGGPNAGHTVYVKGKKYKTHLIPSGIFAGKKCVIGPGCVINIEKFFEEIRGLRAAGFDTSLVKISPNAHIITENHIAYDKQHLAHLGTTCQGIAPCYSDKMLRRGRRAIEVMETEWMWDGKLNGNVLCEGAQSVWLDVDHGDYPYVTSSTTMPYGACSLGFSPRKIGTLYGVAKIYDTKSGVDPLFPETLWDDPVLDKIIQEGGEFGTTTGRKRLVNWLNLDKLIQSIRISGCSVLIINKCDVLETVGVFKLIHNNEVMEFQSMEEMKNYIYHIIIMFSDDVEINDVVFSGNKETVGI
jgi:adenylosuccinate synthase